MPLRKIDLQTIVPPIARTVTLRYKFANQFGGAFVHRTQSDSAPVELSPPGGEIELDLAEPQTIYVQELDGTCGFDIVATSFTF